MRDWNIQKQLHTEESQKVTTLPQGLAQKRPEEMLCSHRRLILGTERTLQQSVFK